MGLLQKTRLKSLSVSKPAQDLTSSIWHLQCTCKWTSNAHIMHIKCTYYALAMHLPMHLAMHVQMHLPMHLQYTHLHYTHNATEMHLQCTWKFTSNAHAMHLQCIFQCTWQCM